MWNGELASVCRRHPDLVAIYEAPDGGLALLLRQTLVPLHEERGRWFNETRRAARAVVTSLRAAGVTDDVSVLQWRQLADVAAVLTGWLCRYLGDPERCAQLSDIVGARLVDREPSAVSPPRAGGEERLPGAPPISSTLLDWYRDMAPCWLAVEPEVRRRLIIRTHLWIVERVLSCRRWRVATSRWRRISGRAVGSSGGSFVPPGELDVWRAWIRLTITDLQRALAWPAGRRSQAWVRWLFDIPYSIPVTGRRPRDVLAGGSTRAPRR